MGVCISKGNSKLGEIKSVSLPSGLTCIKCGCNKKCYAKKIERLRPSVRNSYIRNLAILEEDPQTYWREVEAAIMTSRFFRFHVSGDIPDLDYLITKTIAGLLFDYHGNNNPEEIAKYLVRNNIGLKTR